MSTLSQEIAAILLEIKAVHLRPDNPFTWTSGIKAPLYCDNRQIISYPNYRKKVASAFVETIQSQYLDANLIAGTATAGIAHAAWVADLMNLPMVYIRSSSKGHGLQNLIEGHLAEGSKAVVIEDLISTGMSSINAAEALIEAKTEVLGVCSIFSYQTNKAIEAFKSADIPFSSLTQLDSLLQVAVAKQEITPEQQTTIAYWRDQLGVS